MKPLPSSLLIFVKPPAIRFCIALEMPVFSSCMMGLEEGQIYTTCTGHSPPT